MTEEERQLWKLPPLNMVHVLLYEGANHWLLRLPLPARLSYTWHGKIMRSVFKRIGSNIMKRYRRYLAHHQLGQRTVLNQTDTVTPEVPDLADVEKTLFEGPRPTVQQFMLYELFGTDRLERSAPEQQGAVGLQLEAEAERKYQRYAPVLMRLRKKYIKATLQR